MNEYYKKAIKWSIPVLVAGLVVLRAERFVGTELSVAIAFALELSIIVIVVRRIFLMKRHLKEKRLAGVVLWCAIEDELSSFLPRPVARLIVLELRIWHSLFSWLFGRIKYGSHDFTYHKTSGIGFMLVAVAFSAPIEFLLFDRFIPWSWLKWTYRIAAVYAVFWVFGFFASLKALPHRLSDDGLELHYGLFGDGFVPCGSILHCEVGRWSTPGEKKGLRIDREKNAAYFSVDGMTNLHLCLNAPMTPQGIMGPKSDALEVFIGADEPKKMAEALSYSSKSPPVFKT